MRKYLSAGALILGLLIPSTTFARSQSCTPTITQTEIDSWGAHYQQLVNGSTDAQSAFNAWVATQARSVPELGCLSRAQLAEVYNLQNISLWKDGASNFRNKAGTLSYFNDLVATGGSAYLGTPNKVYFYTGSGLTVGTWTG